VAWAAVLTDSVVRFLWAGFKDILNALCLAQYNESDFPLFVASSAEMGNKPYTYLFRLLRVLTITDQEIAEFEKLIDPIVYAVQVRYCTIIARRLLRCLPPFSDSVQCKSSQNILFSFFLFFLCVFWFRFCEVPNGG
jgi:hypothetical protein